ncbi:helix-turn-helix transcriptional regulator [Denitratisoma oestradiolicum]|uniref:Transcriptional regulator, LuxR-family n=1 Tax=Denitratisoma oestradiolicum TaxID=311182 RepID=A0A6S6Y0B0_9PROT|nr:helix-turn-helix transcriptional regulator [Denitratisoma oestradiolicum]TWO81840.1 hypothetical protein CBW56_03825 [Denitratisoma oestradiolicum]CAB1370808.1 Transcriptional regulator, LuxR-family [Denitratisoma oestradiolicum]
MTSEVLPNANGSELLNGWPVNLEQFSELIRLVYKGPLESVPWCSAAAMMRDCLRANKTTFVLRPASARQPAFMVRDRGQGQGPEVYQDAYNEHEVFSKDPFVGLPAHCVVSIDDVVDVENWLNSDFYKQFVEPEQIRYILGADILVEGGAEFRLRITRSTQQGAFTEGEKNLCQMLLPHFEQALDLQSRLEVTASERSFYAQTVSQMQVGTVVLDEWGSVLHCNDVANGILAKNDGIALSRNRLHASYGHEDRDLQQIIRQALELSLARNGQPRDTIPSDAISISRPSGSAKLSVLVRPILQRDGGVRPSVVLFIRDPDINAAPSLTVLKQLFGFTNAEANLALMLASGLSLDEAATEVGIRKNTVRAYLRSIFLKTGATRQTTLVRLILSSVASIG